MAFKNKNNSQYLRFITKEEGGLNGLSSLTFFTEISRNEAKRNISDEFDAVLTARITFTPEEWDLDLSSGSVSFDGISSECYRCLRLRPGFNVGGDWEDA